MATFFLSFYFLVLVMPAIFGIHRYYLVYLYYQTKKQKPLAPDWSSLGKVPFVTVQLPIYNEKYVIPRLIQAVCAFDYPKDRLEIQVLDDSTDDTVAIVAREIEDLKLQGFLIEHIRRDSREGFKAGALAYGLKIAKGEFVAVFDADFIPEPDFLKKTVPHFYTSNKVGMVQTRWSHINRDYSLLTHAQSVLLDGHFVIEHTARSRSGAFFNFNGTAGIWRKSCIASAGGWSGDTLTEDIDLSYRAQIKGWSFVYLEDVVAPAELPVDINALKSQQHRWAKGSIQVAKKLLPIILKGSFPIRVKVEAFFHLMANFNYVLITLASVMMPISIYLRRQQGWTHFMWIDLPFFISASWSVMVFYYHSQKHILKSRWDMLKYIPLSLALGIGLCINNTRAVIEGLWGETGEFTRTPKFAVVEKGDSWKEKNYKVKLNFVSVIELLMSLHFLVAIYFVLDEGIYWSLPFVLLFEIGYLYTTYLSFQNYITSRWWASEPVEAII